MGPVSLNDVAAGVGIEQVSDRHLEQVPLLRKRILAFGQEIMRDLSRFQQCEESLPGFRPLRENDVTGADVAPDEDLGAFETQIRRQANGLASAVAEQFGYSRHGIYHNIYQQLLCQGWCPRGIFLKHG